MMKNWLRKGEGPSDWFSITYGQNNNKTINPEYIRPFEYAGTERITLWSAEFCQGKWYKRNYWITWQVASNFGRKKRWCYGNWWGAINAYVTT